MAISDIILIALVALFGVIGVLVAVKKKALGFAAFVVAFLIAFFLANVVAEALLTIDGVRSFVLGNSGWSLYTWIYGGLGETLNTHYPIDWTTYEMAGTPTALGTSFFAPIVEIIKNYAYTPQFTADQGLALYMAFLMFSAIVGTGLFIVIRVILIVVTTMIKAFINHKKKTGATRAFGLLVGMVQGFVVSLVLLVMVSSMGGLLFLNLSSDAESPKTIGSDMESSVITKTVGGWAYGVRDALFLPNFDMYGRIVEKSGFTVKEEDVSPGNGTGLIGHDLEMYNYLKNLNYYSGDPYTKNADGYGVEPADKDLYYINYKLYKEMGFGNAVKAILDYNNAAAQIIKDAGTLIDLGMPATKIQTYIEYIHEASNSINNIWRANNGIYDSIYVMLENYNNTLANNKHVTSESAINDANGEFINQYNKIMEQFERIQNQYDNISEFFGPLDISELLPESAYQIPPTGYVPPPHECDDVCPDCGLCLTDCTDPVCGEKCEGHEEEPDPDDPDDPDDSDNPDDPDDPDNPDDPDDPDNPDDPDDPDNPDDPDDPDNPNGGEDEGEDELQPEE